MSPAVTPSDVLLFWFGDPSAPPLARAKTWFQKSDAFDAEARERFEATIERAAKGELDAWRASPEGRLALVITLDQLSRNVFRGTPRSFAQDALAREIAEQAIAAGDLDTLPPVRASFLLMPLMHAEEDAAQRRCVEGFTKLRDAAPPELRDYLQNGLDFAEAHARIIARFGRFPHRNEILGRTSTPEEEAFLKEPNSSF